MQPATVHLLTAFHALAHRLALTADDEAELERHGASLSPALWRGTAGLLHEADRGAPGTSLDIGFATILLRWLGVEDEAGFADVHGLGPGDALERDRGALGPLAEDIERGAGSEAVRDLVSHAWAARGARLMGGLPKTARAVVEALDRAIDGCPWQGSRRRELFEAMVVASEALGDWGRMRDARQWIARLDGEDAFGYIAGQTLLILWCVTHDELLLSSERGLDPGIAPSPAGWARVRAAVEAGRPEDVPAPVRTFAAWSLGDGLDERVLRIAFEQRAPLLPDMARVVERLFEGGDAPEPLLRGAPGRAAPRDDGAPRAPSPPSRGARAVRGRRPDGGRESARGPAAQCESRGEHDQTGAHLAKAFELAGGVVDDPDRRGGAEGCLAEWRWRSGDPAGAGRMLKDLPGPKATGLLRRIEAKEPERATVRWAEQAVRRRGDLESLCRLAHAHLAAGHPIASERMAHELCLAHPDEPLAWATLARVLEDIGRYRDAVRPAREALASGYDEAAGRRVCERRQLRGVGDPRRVHLPIAPDHGQGEPLPSSWRIASPAIFFATAAGTRASSSGRSPTKGSSPGGELLRKPGHRTLGHRYSPVSRTCLHPRGEMCPPSSSSSAGSPARFRCRTASPRRTAFQAHLGPAAPWQVGFGAGATRCRAGWRRLNTVCSIVN